MGKYEADAEDSDARSVKGEDSKVERRHSKHHHHRRSRSHDRSRDKEDRDSMRGELSDSPSHKHRHHHHHHHHSKDEKDEERSKRRHTTSMKHKKSSTDTEDSRHRHHRHSRKNSTSSEKSYGMPTIVGSRLAPTLSDLSIRGSSRRNSRSVAPDEPSYKLTEEPKPSLDTIVVVDDTPTKAETPKVTVVEERTVVVERVVVTEPESIIVDEVVVVVDSTPTPQLVVPQESAPIATIVTTIPSSAATTSSMSAPSSPMPAALAQQPVQQTIIYQQPAPSPSVPSASIVNRRSISDRSDSFTPDAGNPGRLPSPLPSSLRDTKRFSSLIEPPIPWESKKDKKKAKRARKKSEHKKNILGETIYKGHPSWLLMRDIQTGLFQSIKTVSTNATKSAINLFHTPSVQVFPIAPGSTSTFKFKDYCPGAFYKLREHFGINHQDYVASICHNWNEVGTPGKSGSLFFFSQDNQYVLKTIPKREAKLLRTLLPSYYHHMVKNDNSLLTRFMGLHRVKPHKGRQVRFLVMGNLFSGPLKIHQRFDLKGSTVGRELSAEARQKKNPTFKDMDFRRLNKKIPLGPNVRDNFLRQLEEDCKFLVSQNIMDYSLLIGIHFKSEEENDSDYSSQDEPESPMSRSTTNLPAFEVPEDSGHFPRRFESVFEKEEGGLRGRAEDGTELDEFYYIGIIDILMLYTMRKQIEHAYKKVTSRGGEISSVAPDEYAHRFIKFISDIVA